MKLVTSIEIKNVLHAVYEGDYILEKGKVKIFCACDGRTLISSHGVQHSQLPMTHTAFAKLKKYDMKKGYAKSVDGSIYPCFTFK
jgi:hypothetical protein